MTDVPLRAAVVLHAERRTAILLTVAQALGQSGLSLLIVVVPVLGHALAVDKGWATLPIAVQQVAVMAATIPAALLMQRFGRRIGFSAGAIVFMLGAGLAAAAASGGSFQMLFPAAVCFGIAAAFIAQYRFAAADGAGPEFRPRAISMVMAGGIVAGFVGPLLARVGRTAFEGEFVGAFAILAGLGFLALVILQFVRIPGPTAAERTETGRPLGEIVRQPGFIVAATSAAVGFGVMALIMTSTPISMMAHNHSFDDSAFVIQWHVVAMFAPSFFTGRLIGRFGASRIVAVGVALNVACVAVNLSGTSVAHYWFALASLGLGWNFMFIGGTALLADSHHPAERGKVQGLNDFLVFGVTALASLSSGAVQSAVGWQAVNLAVLPFLAAAFAGLVWLGLQTRARRAA